jgi:hypothetical protein
MNLMFYLMLRIPSLRRKMYKEANRRMISPLEKVLRE